MFLQVLTHFTCVFACFNTFLANKSEMALGKAKHRNSVGFSWNSVGDGWPGFGVCDVGG